MGKGLFKNIKTIIKEVIEIIYPIEEKCTLCNADGFIKICPNCKSMIKRSEITNQEEISYGFYGGILKELVLSFKYKKNFVAGEVLADLFIEIIREQNINADYICYIPMSKKAEKKRGFNQCEVIAKNVSEYIDIPINNSIIKNKYTKEQKKLSKEQRILNVKGAFSIKRKSNLYGKDIILIDDVTTTGATLTECRKVLKKYGVNKIICLTIAKSNI